MTLVKASRSSRADLSRPLASASSRVSPRVAGTDALRSRTGIEGSRRTMAIGSAPGGKTQQRLQDRGERGRPASDRQKHSPNEAAKQRLANSVVFAGRQA